MIATAKNFGRGREPIVLDNLSYASGEFAMRVVSFGAVSIRESAPESKNQMNRLANALLLPPNKDLRIVAFTGAQYGSQSQILCMQMAELLADSFSYKVCMLDTCTDGPTPSVMGWMFDEAHDDDLARDRTGIPQMQGEVWCFQRRQLATYLNANIGPELLQLRLSHLRSSYDFVLINAPEPKESYGAAIASQSDGVLLIVEAGRVSRTILNQAKQTLDRVNANLIGTVLTNRVLPIPERIFRWLRL